MPGDCGEAVMDATVSSEPAYESVDIENVSYRHSSVIPDKKRYSTPIVVPLNRQPVANEPEVLAEPARLNEVGVVELPLYIAPLVNRTYGIPDELRNILLPEGFAPMLAVPAI